MSIIQIQTLDADVGDSRSRGAHGSDEDSQDSIQSTSNRDIRQYQHKITSLAQNRKLASLEHEAE